MNTIKATEQAFFGGHVPLIVTQRYFKVILYTFIAAQYAF